MSPFLSTLRTVVIAHTRTNTHHYRVGHPPPPTHLRNPLPLSVSLDDLLHWCLTHILFSFKHSPRSREDSYGQLARETLPLERGSLFLTLKKRTLSMLAQISGLNQIPTVTPIRRREKGHSGQLAGGQAGSTLVFCSFTWRVSEDARERRAFCASDAAGMARGSGKHSIICLTRSRKDFVWIPERSREC